MQIPDSWHLPAGNGGDQLRLILFLDNQFKNPFGAQGVEQKVKFIENCIYNHELTWYNWTTHINKYKYELDYVIDTTCQRLEKNGFDKELFLDIKDKNLILSRYFHIKLADAARIHDPLMLDWENFIKTVKSGNTRKIINSDFLHSPTLSRSIYDEIIKFYEFDDNYESANKIHQLHYQCHQKSLKDFCDAMSGVNFDNFLKSIRVTLSNATYLCMPSQSIPDILI